MITVGRLEYATLIVIMLCGVGARRAGANEWLVVAVVLLVALMIRRARNRGVLDRLVAACKSSA